MSGVRRSVRAAILVVSVGVGLAAVSGAAVAGSSTHRGMGPGMMSGALGVSGLGAKPTGAQLTRVAERVDHWLAVNDFKAFQVAEVMAFSNNDYVAVHDAHGNPAFELLVAPDLNWLMEEPPSMMWNTKYGMLSNTSGTVEPIPGLSMMWGGGMMGSPRSWYGSGTGRVTTTAQAVGIANRWLATRHAGEHVAGDAGGSAMGKFPGYYSFDTTLRGKTFGMLSVNATTGAVWYHGWHGTFLAEKDFTT